MTVVQIIEILEKRRAHLTQLRNSFDAQRDLDRATSLDAEIAETEATLAQLRSI
jgi:hypothetical protein